jgi:hypothetical protein
MGGHHHPEDRTGHPLRLQSPFSPPPCSSCASVLPASIHALVPLRHFWCFCLGHRLLTPFLRSRSFPFLRLPIPPRPSARSTAPSTRIQAMAPDVPSTNHHHADFDRDVFCCLRADCPLSLQIESETSSAKLSTFRNSRQYKLWKVATLIARPFSQKTS